MRGTASLVSATALLMFALGVMPVAAQERQYAITMFDFDGENRQAPKEIVSRILLPRGTGFWRICIYGYNSANKGGSIKFALGGYTVWPDNPLGVDQRFSSRSGKVKVRRGNGEAYGDSCIDLKFHDWRGLVLYDLSINLRNMRTQPPGSRGEWGMAAWPLPPGAVAQGLQGSSRVGPSTGPVEYPPAPR